MTHPSRPGTSRRRLAGIGICAAVLLAAPTLPMAAQPQRPAIHAPAAAAHAGFLTDAAPGAVSVSKLIGADVVGSAGRSLGTVADVVFRRGGGVESLVVATGGFLGIGEKHAVVPWAPARMRMQGPYLVTHLARAHLRAAPDAARP